MLSLEECIRQHGDENNTWYIDVKGRDQNGNFVWISGNVLHQEEYGYGGFYTYNRAKFIIDNFEKVVAYDDEVYKNASEDRVISFTPIELYIGYAPLNDEEYNMIFRIRSLK